MEALVIASEPVLGTAWKYLLEERGYNVLLASSGADTVDVGRFSAPDLIMFDADDMLGTGQSLADIEVIKDALPEVPMLVLASWNLDREKALARGATVCVSKPVDYGTVLRLADMIVSHSSNKRTAVTAE